MSAYSVTIAIPAGEKALACSPTIRGLGETVGEVLFRLPLLADLFRNRRPDVAYVSFGRWPSGSRDAAKGECMGCRSRSRGRSDEHLTIWPKSRCKKLASISRQVFNLFGSSIPNSARSMSTKRPLESAFWPRTTLWTAGQSYLGFSCAWIASLIQSRRRIKVHRLSQSFTSPTRKPPDARDT